MQRVKLDSIDRRILRDLQQDGRVTNVDLAERAGISAPPCLRRVRALEREGYIQGYHAELNPEKLGFTVIIFAFVGLSSQAENDLVAFEDMMGNQYPQGGSFTQVSNGVKIGSVEMEFSQVSYISIF